MPGITDLVIVTIALGTALHSTEANVLNRVRRQSQSRDGEVIDNIFNIPITAIQQTSAAAQNLYPDGSSGIDSFFNIPVATLEAVSNLVKNRNTLSQRRPADVSTDIQKRRKEKRDRILAHRQEQRLQHKDPLGLNAFTDLLVGNHGLFSGHGFWGGLHGSLGDHFSSHLSSHFGGHGSSHGHGDGDDQDSFADNQDDSGMSSSSNEANDNVYEVTEEVDEDKSGSGGWFDFNSWLGGHKTSSPSRNQNKIAPRPERRKYSKYVDDQDAPLENKIAPKIDRNNRYRNQYPNSPLENKIAPREDRKYYRRNHGDLPLENRVAPRPEGRSRIVFEY
ncbi:uncharacterized protein LOC124409563 [Diprion similis]|uniref:uncharacterized protein LOC124409563 n=1 Tax=Diprion similis TaxID=362088 RepID=UPI001EF78A01|nr:uncharacterized protein LOC124409563 [Diprion similis]